MTDLRDVLAAQDPIVAVSTPPGRGAVGIVRVSGSALPLERLAAAVVPGVLPPRQAVLRRVLDASGELLDRALVVRFVGPNSYTGEDVLEVQLHGNPVILRACVQAFVAAGARPAEPGEFTRRAVMNGRLDLVEAEAVDAVVRAATEQAVRAAQRHLGGELSTRLGAWRDELLQLAVVLEALVDFPEDVQESELEAQLAGLTGLADRMDALAATFDAGRRMARGARVVLSGPVNAGKSTLFNALLGHERAIVSEHAGTTRDVVSEAVDWDGVAVRLEDTAGQRETADPVEAEGVARSQRASDAADLVVHVRDSRTLERGEHPPAGGVGVATHQDLDPRSGLSPGWHRTRGDGRVENIRAAIVEALSIRDTGDLLIHTERQKNALLAAAEATREASGHGAQESVLCAVAVRAAGSALDELLGGWTSESVLDALFSRFCIGK